MVKNLGGRKFALGILYMLICGSIAGLAVWKDVVGWDAAGVASMFVSMATGVGVVVWGNVKAKELSNGGNQ